MRPQFGSPPHQLVLTSELLATARTAASASAKDLAPLTRKVTKRETPSPSRTIILANSRQTWLRANWKVSASFNRAPGGPWLRLAPASPLLAPALSASPLARRSTVSLVL